MLAAIFYADYRLLASPRPARLQKDLGILMGLLNRVGLRTNVNKTVVIICQLCCIDYQQSKVTYNWKIKGEGPYYSARNSEWSRCLD